MINKQTVEDIGRELKPVILNTDQSVDCYTTDVGPDINIFPERVVDLSSYAFSQIGNLQEGVLHNVKVEEI